MTTYGERLLRLRAAMEENAIDAYIILSGDPHLGEYVPDHWRIIAWLTGFTGSAASVVVTDTFAGLWTDSRYFIQAQNQLDNSDVTLMKPLLKGKNDFIDWLAENINNGSTIFTDGRTISIGKMRRIEHATKGKDITLLSEPELISDIWTDRPELPLAAAYDFPLIYAGKDRTVKIAEVREEMRQRRTDYHLLTSVDDIMWILNIRGSDVKYSPLMTSFAIIGEEQILLFADEGKIPYRLASDFDRIGIVILPYEETAGMLSTLPVDCSVLISPLQTSAALFYAIPKEMKIIEGLSIPAKLKAVKNKTEIENIGKAMVKDGVALTKFFFWIEQNNGLTEMSELSLDEKLTGFRSVQENFLSSSFSSIVAYNENGALPHYSATAESNKIIGPDGILLVDSGGQYLNGTTDITRTVAIGRPTAKQKRDFTLVLAGNIDLATVRFPSGTKGVQLDILARRALWAYGLDYGHGTGHGVGFCLNVHEGPQSISPGDGAETKTVIVPGMLISNEPAIYREGEYGIRIENLLLCYADEENEFGNFLKFDTVSLCYIDKSLIDVSLLDRKQIDWLNSYHTEVYEKLSPCLTPEEALWLKDKTSPF